MLVNVIKTDLFNIKPTPNAIAHSANCFHTMGVGVAVGMRHATQDRIFNVDKTTPYGDVNKLGTTSSVTINGVTYVNIYGQHAVKGRDGGVYVHFESIKRGILSIFKKFQGVENFRLAIPLMGCGLAGGKLSDFIKTINELCAEESCHGELIIAVISEIDFEKLLDLETGITPKYRATGFRPINLNPALLKSQGIGTECENRIRELSTELDALLARPDMFCDSPVDAVNKIEAYEYALQAMWKFKLDSAFHSYWFKVSGCKCPKDDNIMMFGSHFRTINHECPFHGADPKHYWSDSDEQ